MKRIYPKHVFAALVLLCGLGAPAMLRAQEERTLAPVSGTYAITNATVIQAPGRKLEHGTVVVKNGLISAVGKGIAIPPEAIVIKGDSLTIYAGFIDGLSRTGVTKPKDENKEKPKDPGNPSPERAGITPQNDVRDFLNPADKSVEELRALGFTTAQVVPYGGMLPGSGAIVSLGASSPDKMVLLSKTAFYSELTTAERVYPNTVLGVMAKYRELYRQAVQAKAYESLYASNRAGLERPSPDRILEAFYPVIDKRIPVVFKTEKILDLQRAFTLQADLGFPLIAANVKEGWDMLPRVKATGTKVFLSLDLPEEKKEEKKDPKAKPDPEKDQLEKRKAEFVTLYAAQAGAFQKAGIPFGFSTLTAKTKDIPANLRRMIKAGLTEDQALAALTTNAAQILGLSDRLGSIDNGKIANLVITDKSYFDEKSKVRYVFVDGTLYKFEAKETKKSDGKKVDVSGTWSYSTETPQGANNGKLKLKKDGDNYTGTITSTFSDKEIELKSVSVEGSQLTFTYTIRVQGSGVNVEATATVDGDAFDGSMTAGQYGSFPMKGTKDPNR
ncbi:amidohydrolase family protein [Chryseolinea lacunae]|uniref:Amidohydrolase family protein n=1 Tax=Chryseolinea lacunae TaxID=2801331 RepID=A0ABS1KL65_9BACT|nr:amidohydrolase family protein [Chryseolinea lacunae]MBL0740090.1 amidohydrolase family protein [Chryseolinea lacunae]